MQRKSKSKKPWSRAPLKCSQNHRGEICLERGWHWGKKSEMLSEQWERETDNISLHYKNFCFQSEGSGKLVNDLDQRLARSDLGFRRNRVRAPKNESQEIPLEVIPGENNSSWSWLVAVVVMVSGQILLILWRKVFDVGLNMGCEGRSRVEYDPKISILSKRKNGAVIYWYGKAKSPIFDIIFEFLLDTCRSTRYGTEYESRCQGSE